MTCEFDRRSGVHTFSCDQRGCHKNYEGQSGDHKFAWRCALNAGWVHVKDYKDSNIGVSRHYCPDHSERFERVLRPEERRR